MTLITYLARPSNVGPFAGLINFGLLLFNLGFTESSALAEPYAQVFSTFGQVMVLVWGVAFALAGFSADDEKPSMIWWAFALEKLVYVIAYAIFWTGPNASLLRWDGTPKQLLVPLFYTIFGIVDLSFLILFAHLGWRATTARAQGRKTA